MALNSTAGDPAADSYVDLVFATAYHGDLGNAAWVAAQPADQEGAVRRATMWIDGAYRTYFAGQKANGRAQPLEWPRKDAVDADGYAIGPDEIPVEIMRATCEAALRELASPNSLNPDVTTGGAVKREKVGPLEVEYSTASDSNAMKPVLTAVDAILGSLFHVNRGSGTKLVNRA